MNTSSPGRSSRTDIAKSYFRRVDSGDFPTEYFTADFEFYVPKFGIGRGASSFHEMVRGVQPTRVQSCHHHESLQFIEAGNKLVVEGTTEGLGLNNVAWCGGKTPGGRFCSVFEFDEQSLIKRMYIYLDPDFTSADKDRFLWPQRSQIEW
jgi:SnoaL-like domain